MNSSAARAIWFIGCLMIWGMVIGLIWDTTESITWSTGTFWFVLIMIFGPLINPLKR